RGASSSERPRVVIDFSCSVSFSPHALDPLFGFFIGLVVKLKHDLLPLLDLREIQVWILKSFD
ncbi:hypothetical protein, partial [Ralstonia pseudosolanacearum]|uniref:hypothetical protein n=1 Tax=Ralstonia pseudosolanacearum TaxID=1310165 RepID=UPI003CFB4AC2